MHRFLHIGIVYYYEFSNYKDLEIVFNFSGDDWVRYSGTNWIVWTDKSVQYWNDTVRTRLPPNSQLLIVKLDTSERHGLLPKWIWEWLDRPRTGTAVPNALASLLSPPAPPLTGMPPSPPKT